MFDRSLILKWIRKADKTVLGDDADDTGLETCLQDIPLLVTDDMEKMRFITESQELQLWLTAPTSRVLIIDAETPPDDLANPVACVSATLASTLQTSCGDFFVLFYMCSYRACSSMASSNTPALLVRSLAAQLLLQIADKELDIDVSFLMDKEYRRYTRKTLSGSLNLLGRLLQRLSAGETVVIIMDSVSHLPGTLNEGAEDMKNLLETIDGSEAVVKVLMTLPGPPQLAEVERNQWPILYVPDSLEALYDDVDVDSLAEQVELMATDFRLARQEVLRRGEEDYLQMVMDDTESSTSAAD